jgi:hypothetical protein
MVPKTFPYAVSDLIRGRKNGGHWPALLRDKAHGGLTVLEFIV